MSESLCVSDHVVLGTEPCSPIPNLYDARLGTRESRSNSERLRRQMTNVGDPAPIPFLDLVTPHRELADELMAVVKAALSTGRFIGGPMLLDFEKNFADYCDVPYSVGVSSGTMGELLKPERKLGVLQSPLPLGEG